MSLEFSLSLELSPLWAHSPRALVIPLAKALSLKDYMEKHKFLFYP
jgi:hypothetical protein